ncbi:MAG: CapA family protein, partial [Oscillospiraceae bacterium]
MKKRLFALAAALLLLSGCTKVEPRPAQSSDAESAPVTENSAAESTVQTQPLIATAEPTEESAEPQKPHETEYVSVKLLCAGDNLIHSPIYRQAAARAGGDGYDFSYAYEHVAPLIEEADLAILNQETIITDEFEPSTYPCFTT